MKCLLVFDQRCNDVIYTKCDKKFAQHLNEYAKTQELLSETYDTMSKLCTNVIVQIFSPIVTSQRIMSCQFGNSYTSIQCENNLNVTFEEYMGYLFLCISPETVQHMKRFLSVCITLTRYLCGPDVLQLRNGKQSVLLTRLIDCWCYLRENDQALFIEGVEQLLVGNDTAVSMVRILREAVDKLQFFTDCTKIHGVLLANNKLLGLYSSQNAMELSAIDLLVTILLSDVSSKVDSVRTETDLDSEDDEYFSPSTSPDTFNASISSNLKITDSITTYQILLSGTDFVPKCIPHLIHVHSLDKDITLIFIAQTGNPSLASHLYNSFFHLHSMQTAQIQRDVDTLRPIFEKLDASVRKLCDGLKKVKKASVELNQKKLMKQWDFMKKKYSEFIKTQSPEALLRAESSTGNLLEVLREVLIITASGRCDTEANHKAAIEASKVVIDKLSNFNDFFKMKGMNNFTLGSYLEEFPGLVHFIYVDRTNHRVTTPSLDFSSEETINLTKKKIWWMINFSKMHLEEGHLLIMWKDTTFCYSYFLWFEDNSGAPLKPTVFPTHASKALPLSGVLCGDFYLKLKETCFPKMSPNKVRCYEMYCVHLGLVTAQCVLEHSRRLAATIWELKGHPDQHIDLI